MKKKMLMFAALGGLVALSSCVKDNENSYTEAIRTAKVQELQASAAFQQAEATIRAAEAAVAAQKSAAEVAVLLAQAENEAANAKSNLMNATNTAILNYAAAYNTLVQYKADLIQAKQDLSQALADTASAKLAVTQAAKAAQKQLKDDEAALAILKSDKYKDLSTAEYVTAAAEKQQELAAEEAALVASADFKALQANQTALQKLKINVDKLTAQYDALNTMVTTLPTGIYAQANAYDAATFGVGGTTPINNASLIKDLDNTLAKTAKYWDIYRELTTGFDYAVDENLVIISVTPSAPGSNNRADVYAESVIDTLSVTNIGKYYKSLIEDVEGLIGKADDAATATYTMKGNWGGNVKGTAYATKYAEVAGAATDAAKQTANQNLAQMVADLAKIKEEQKAFEDALAEFDLAAYNKAVADLDAEIEKQEKLQEKLADVKAKLDVLESESAALNNLAVGTDVAALIENLEAAIENDKAQIATIEATTGYTLNPAQTGLAAPIDVSYEDAIEFLTDRVAMLEERVAGQQAIVDALLAAIEE